MKIRYILIACLLLVTFTSTTRMPRVAYIIVSKEDLRMKAFDCDGRQVLEYPIACGQNYGQKKQAGDNRTPEGTFKVIGKESSSHWTYDFGNGPVKGAYGPVFIRLNTPGFSGIGIHGTHDAGSVPGRATHGCIRLKNQDLLTLSSCVTAGAVVIILPE